MRATDHHSGLDELALALSAVGLSLRPQSDDHGDAGGDALVSAPRGDEFAIEVKRVSLPNVEALRNSGAGPGASSAEGGRARPLLVVVADRVPEPVRAWMRQAGIGWLDLRGPRADHGRDGPGGRA